ncbi:hypothetical protein O7623_20230 [Solwaraspora sp. WMMD791]|uniref:hypothetical protein n=1 Tax=Solwaraspora sp. WMMD791 TaxID=3016086 RepID=UPI00249BD356|nr:hypothetical protein [Solwaraspora sp. WMMD791]WFE25689.1 hypothetical protein O7623_20230 [Solwaraspora sp. WMMD791]
MDPDKPLQSLSESELSSARWGGVSGAEQETHRRELERQLREREANPDPVPVRRPGRGPAAGVGTGWLWNLLLLVLPVVVLGAVLSGLTRGTAWLATESVLAPLFPAPGDSPARYLLSLVTLLVLVPGSLAVLAARLQPTALRLPARLILMPAALLLVPVVCYVTELTATADLMRLPS